MLMGKKQGAEYIYRRNMSTKPMSKTYWMEITTQNVGIELTIAGSEIIQRN